MKKFTNFAVQVTRHIFKSLNFKFLNLILLFCISAFLLTPTTAQAQCNQITMTAVPTEAFCLNNGTITLTIDGPDVGNIILSSAQLRVTADKTGNNMNWFTPTDAGAVKTITGLMGGDSYTVELRALCKSNPTGGWGVTGVTARAKITTNYWPISYGAYEYRSTLSCLPTGEIYSYIYNGRPPYTIEITSYPTAYTGDKIFTTSESSHIIKDLPEGQYILRGTDDCGNFNTATVDVNVKTSDIPECTTSVIQTGGCLADGAAFSFSWGYGAPDPALYEYAIVKNDAPGPKTWKDVPFTSSSFTHTEPVDISPYTTYQDFYNSGDEFWLYLRLKACPSIEKGVAAYNYPLQTYNYFTQNYVDYTCTTAKFRAGVSNGSCETLLHWELWETDQWYAGEYTLLEWGDVDVTSGGQLGGVAFTTENAYPCGAYYKIIMTRTADGSLAHVAQFNCPINEVLNVQGVYGEGEDKVTKECFGKTISLFTNPSYWSLFKVNLYFTPQTKITYKSGPIALPMGPVGSSAYGFKPYYPIETQHCSSYTNLCTNKWVHICSATIWRDTVRCSNFYPLLPAGYTNTVNSQNPVPSNINMDLPAGDYEFEIEDACSNIIPVTITVPDIEYIIPDEIYYTLNITCNGAEFWPTDASRIQIIDNSTNQTDYVHTCYVMLEGPTYCHYYKWKSDGNYIDWSPYESAPYAPLMMNVPGKYKIGLWNAANCQLREIWVDVDLTNLTYHANSLSHYVCDGQGHIYVQAKNGTPPFIYTLAAPGTTTPIATCPNNPCSDGKFLYGNAGDIFDILITDDCNRGATIKNVKMLDLATASVAYSNNGSTGDFCHGQLVELNAIGLGENVVYEWYEMPANTLISTEQNPRFPAVYTDGTPVTYKVVVQPEGCSTPKEDFLTITIHESPLAPTLITPSIANGTFCAGTPITLTASGGESSIDADYEWGIETCLEWVNDGSFVGYCIYGYNFTFFPEETGPTFTVTPLYNTKYAVRRVAKGLCEGLKTDFAEIEITPLPFIESYRIDYSDFPICSGQAVSITAEISEYYQEWEPNTYTFRWYDSQTSTTPLHTEVSNTKSTYTPATAFTTTTTFYVSLQAAGFCESPIENRFPITVTVRHQAMENDITVTGNVFCMGEPNTLEATTALPGTTEFYWFDAPNAINPIATGAGFTPDPQPTVTTKYWVSVAGSDICENAPENRKEVTVTLRNCNCEKPVVTPKNTCE